MSKHITQSPIVAIFALLLFFSQQTFAEVVLNKGAPGVGVVNPKEWIKDHIENNFKDAVFGSQVDAGMDVIFQKVYDKFISSAKSDRSLRRCRGAAFTQAYNVAGELSKARVLRGAADMVWDIEKRLITLGGGSIADFLQNQAEGFIRNKIADAMKDQQTVVYENTYSFDGGEQAVRAVWNKSAGTYVIFFTGNSHCNEVRDQWIGGNKIRLAEWTVVARGTVSVQAKKDKSGLLISASFPTLSISANCNCVKGDGDTWYPPPPIEEEDDDDDDSEEDEDGEREESPLRLPKMGVKRMATGVQCPACEPKLEAVNRISNRFNDLARTMDALADEIYEDKYESTARAAKASRWARMKENLDAIEASGERAFDAFVLCEQQDCDLGEGVIDIGYFQDIRETWTDCEPCIPLMEEVNGLIADYNAAIKPANDLYQSSKRLEYGTIEGNRAFRQYQAFKATLDPQRAVIEAKKGALSACKAKNCTSGRWEHYPKLSPASGTCIPCKPEEARFNEAIAESNAVTDKINRVLDLQKAYVQEFGDSWGAGFDGLHELNQREGFHELIGEARRTTGVVDTRRRELNDCIRNKCNAIVVEVIDVKNVVGNNGFSPVDPLAPEASEATIGGTGSSSGGESTGGGISIGGGTGGGTGGGGTGGGGGMTPPIMVTFNPMMIQDRHVVGTSPCNDPMGSVTVQLASGNNFTVSNIMVSGAINGFVEADSPSMSTPLPSHSIDFEFNCASAATTVRTGNVTADISDSVTSETASVSVPVTNEVTNLITVVPFGATFIPVSKLSLVGAHPLDPGPPPTGCLSPHYHGTATACDGSMATDPDPGQCGYGIDTSAIQIEELDCDNP
ncbi:MAG: hypothetical protein GKR93_01330 [Gammaproteobacteria bacterium]|nr:hypothetical protein [Gammaproteobacteria bacterium]